jgi:hypothetical protein
MHQGGAGERETDRDRGETINKHKDKRIKFKGRRFSKIAKGPVTVMT